MSNSNKGFEALAALASFVATTCNANSINTSRNTSECISTSLTSQANGFKCQYPNQEPAKVSMTSSTTSSDPGVLSTSAASVSASAVPSSNDFVKMMREATALMVQQQQQDNACAMSQAQVVSLQQLHLQQQPQWEQLLMSMVAASNIPSVTVDNRLLHSNSQINHGNQVAPLPTRSNWNGISADALQVSGNPSRNLEMQKQLNLYQQFVQNQLQPPLPSPPNSTSLAPMSAMASTATHQSSTISSTSLVSQQQHHHPTSQTCNHSIPPISSGSQCDVPSLATGLPLKHIPQPSVTSVASGDGTDDDSHHDGESDAGMRSSSQHQFLPQDRNLLKRAANRRSAQLSRKRKKVFIDELKVENADLRRKEQILRSIPDLVVVFDSSGKLMFVSQSVRRFLNCTAQELEGTSFWTHICSESVKILKSAFIDALAARNGDTETVPLGNGVLEIQLIDPTDGSPTVVRLNGVVHFAGDRPECVCSIRPHHDLKQIDAVEFSSQNDKEVIGVGNMARGRTLQPTPLHRSCSSHQEKVIHMINQDGHSINDLSITSKHDRRSSDVISSVPGGKKGMSLAARIIDSSNSNSVSDSGNSS